MLQVRRPVPGRAARARCYAPGCRRRPRHRLRRLPMCAAHYVEALEHCADWELPSALGAAGTLRRPFPRNAN